MQKANDLTQRNQNLSIADNMIDLATTMEFECHILETIKKNWDITMNLNLQCHKPFFEIWFTFESPTYY